MKNLSHKLLLAAFAFSAMLGAQTASAALITYNVTLTPTAGSFATGGSGTFTINSPTATPNGYFNSGSSNLTSFSFLIDGNSFTSANGYPGIGFSNGNLTAIDYYGSSNNGLPTLQLNGLSFVYLTTYNGYNFPPNVRGNITASVATQVPEPSTLSLLGLGALGVALLSRARRRNASAVA